MVTVNETLVREILDRLIRLETLVQANGQRTLETANLLREAILRANELEAKTARDRREEADRRREQKDKLLFYALYAVGAGVVAAVLATQILD